MFAHAQNQTSSAKHVRLLSPSQIVKWNPPISVNNSPTHPGQVLADRRKFTNLLKYFNLMLY